MAHPRALVRWLLGLLLCIALPAQAHTTSTGLATLDASSDTPRYRLSLNPGELGTAAADLQPGANGDAAAAARVAGWLQAHVSLAVDEQPCRIQRTRLQATQLGDERVLLMLDFACPARPGRLVLGDRLWRQFGEHYRSIVSITRPPGSAADAGAREEHILDREHPEARADFGRPAPSGLGGFMALGGEHILGGADHLLFLAALLVGVRSLRRLLVTVTAFTLAHSLSLALAVLGWVTLAPAIVEPLIAASIVWVALENIWLTRGAAPAAPTKAAYLRRYVLAFGFGLIHGLAFAEALQALQLAGWPLARALLGFNLGVEAGQALAVGMLAPLLAWAARRPGAQRWERLASGLIALAGLAWLVQRLAG